MAEFKYGDVLRLTDKFISEQGGIRQPDPYRVFFIAYKANYIADFLGTPIAVRPRAVTQIGEIAQLASNAFEKVDD